MLSIPGFPFFLDFFSLDFAVPFLTPAIFALDLAHITSGHGQLNAPCESE
jgi:hypothetical protein